VWIVGSVNGRLSADAEIRTDKNEEIVFIALTQLVQTYFAATEIRLVNFAFNSGSYWGVIATRERPRIWIFPTWYMQQSWQQTQTNGVDLAQSQMAFLWMPPTRDVDRVICLLDVSFTGSIFEESDLWHRPTP
jgi:hypothetical protein